MNQHPVPQVPVSMPTHQVQALAPTSFQRRPNPYARLAQDFQHQQRLAKGSFAALQERLMALNTTLADGTEEDAEPFQELINDSTSTDINNTNNNVTS